MDRVKDKVALVTGGSKGIGKSACLLLAREGAAVAVTDIELRSGRGDPPGRGGRPSFTGWMYPRKKKRRG